MASAWWARLPDRGVVSVKGADAQHFLQNLVTNDVDGLAPGDAGYGALLSPQGKVLFDFLLFAVADGYLLDVPKALATDLVGRLGLYRLRSKVEVADRSADMEIQVAWGMDTPPGDFTADPRVSALGYRRIADLGDEPMDAGIELDADAFADHRVNIGVPAGGDDFSYGDAFPHDADIDQLAGVDFRKGCFIGQEVVSRMQHRGTARRRIVHVRGSGLSPGADIMDGDLPAGSVGSTVGRTGLALVRLDRAAQASAAGRSLTVNGHPVEIEVPAWASFALDLPPEQ